MSSRRSDTEAEILAATGPADRGGAGTAGANAGGSRGWRGSPWWETLKSNAPVPVVILLFVLLAPWVEGREFGAYNRRVVMLVGFNVVLAVSLQLINGFSGQFSLGHAGFMMVGAYLAAYPAVHHSKRLADPGTTLWFYVSLGAVTVAAAIVVIGLFLAIRASRKVRRWLPTVLLIAVAAWVVVDLSQGSRHADPPAKFVWSRGIVVVQQSFAWLMENGAPTAAKVSEALPAAARAPATFVVLLVGAGLCAAGAGLVVGIPALRLRGDYLAIATLGMAEIIRILIQNSPPLGGALGLTGIPKYTDFAWLYGFVAITVAVIWRLAYSARGRAIMAVREDEIAAAAVGIDTTHQKVLAFVTGAFFGGCAGAMFAMHERSITPSYFSIAKSIEIVVMVTLGGLGSISGAILAAIILTLLPEVLRPIAEYRMIIYSLLLVFMMLLRPQGLLGGRELWPRRRGPRPRAAATDDRDDREAGVVTR
jgi:ABC-type branched-subunit amino acid transport system permease subunit